MTRSSSRPLLYLPPLLLLLLHALSLTSGLAPAGKPLAPPVSSRRELLAASGSSLVLPSVSSLLVPRVAAAAADLSKAGVVALPGGVDFPLASFGLQIYDDNEAYKLTLLALEKGYRNFFASVLAGNQRGFARAVKDSGIKREELFICGSVVSNRASGFDAAYAATTRGWKQNMGAFSQGNIDYLDQIMLDYPGPDCESIRGQWRAFEDMTDQKLTRTLSVSNFSPAQLDCVLSDKGSKYKPVVNQLPFSVSYHPGGPASKTVAANRERGVLVQAWAPLGGSLGGRFSKSLVAKCGEVGAKYKKSWAQVALRWVVQSGAAFTTCSKNPAHFAEDLQIFDFEISAEDMATLDALA